MRIQLPSGGYATVQPSVKPETVNALDEMLRAARRAAMLEKPCPLCGAQSGQPCRVLARAGAGRSRFEFQSGKHVMKRTSIPHRQRLTAK